jgi:hypothetical protein
MNLGEPEVECHGVNVCLHVPKIHMLKSDAKVVGGVGADMRVEIL